MIDKNVRVPYQESSFPGTELNEFWSSQAVFLPVLYLFHVHSISIYLSVSILCSFCTCSDLVPSPFFICFVPIQGLGRRSRQMNLWPMALESYARFII